MQMRSRCSFHLMFPALLILYGSPASAHHSPGAFDITREITIEGIVSEVSWRNPHVYLTVETEGANGEKALREIEAAAASSLVAYGVQPEDLAVGERVRIRANPNRRGADAEVLGLSLTLADGRELALRAGITADPASQATASSLAGQWIPDATSFAALSLTAQAWPLTPAGQKAAADLGARSQAAADCSPFGIPVLMVMPNTTTIVLADDRITFDIDGIKPAREVHLATEFPHELQPSAAGYSIGHWEAETLVVETIGFAADPEGLGFAIPSSAKKHVFERFTLSADKRSLVYEAKLEDPEYLTEPVDIRTTWAYRPDVKPSGLDCNLESALRFQAGP